MSRKRPYEIKQYTYDKADKYDVFVQTSHKKNYKVDVFKDGQYVCSIGDIRYSDYPTYIEEKGLDYAEKRRKLYHIRHHKEANSYGTPGWYSYHLLW